MFWSYCPAVSTRLLLQCTIKSLPIEAVIVHTCSKCNGAGTRNYEKVEYGIYNKYTTRGTTTYTDLCEQCKGDGVVGY